MSTGTFDHCPASQHGDPRPAASHTYSRTWGSAPEEHQRLWVFEGPGNNAQQRQQRWQRSTVTVPVAGPTSWQHCSPAAGAQPCQLHLQQEQAGAHISASLGSCTSPHSTCVSPLALVHSPSTHPSSPTVMYPPPGTLLTPKVLLDQPHGHLCILLVLVRAPRDSCILLPSLVPPLLVLVRSPSTCASVLPSTFASSPGVWRGCQAPTHAPPGTRVAVTSGQILPAEHKARP